jgi:hypothetical protein
MSAWAHVTSAQASTPLSVSAAVALSHAAIQIRTVKGYTVWISARAASPSGGHRKQPSSVFQRSRFSGTTSVFPFQNEDPGRTKKESAVDHASMISSILLTYLERVLSSVTPRLAAASIMAASTTCS